MTALAARQRHRIACLSSAMSCISRHVSRMVNPSLPVRETVRDPVPDWVTLATVKSFTESSSDPGWCKASHPLAVTTPVTPMASTSNLLTAGNPSGPHSFLASSQRVVVGTAAPGRKRAGWSRDVRLSLPVTEVNIFITKSL